MLSGSSPPPSASASLPDVRAGHLRPPVRPHVIHAHRAAGKRVSKRRVVDRPSPQLARVLDAQIPPVPLVQHAVREQRPGPDAEPLPFQPRAVAVDVVQTRAVEIPPGDHRPHGQPLPAVAVKRVRQQLRRAGDADALAVLELVEAALDPEVPLPELAVRGAAGHRSEEVRVDLDHLLYRLRRDVRPLRRARVHRDDDAVLEDEPERRRAVVGLDVVHDLALERVVLRDGGEDRWRRGGVGDRSSDLARGVRWQP
eukprot:30672-Pelagococcus_subviridis.AAC.3